MSKGTLEIIGEHRDGKFVFDLSFNGKRFDAYRATVEGAKIASDLETTAWRKGYFRYINASQRFENAFDLDGSEKSHMVEAFQRQGYTVLQRGNWSEPTKTTAPDWTPSPEAGSRPIPQARGQGRRQVADAPAMAYGL